MNSPDGLGVFCRLPREIRQSIWTFVDPAEQNVLVTSKRLRSEIASLFSKLDICITISPVPHRVYPSGIDMCDQYKQWPPLYPAFLDFSSSDPERVNILLKLKFSVCRSVTIELHRPDPQDPGQLIRCWNCAVWLVDFFQRSSSSLPTTLIAFQNSTNSSWSCNSQLTLPSVPLSVNNVWTSPESDLELLLQPFQRLRRTNLSIDIPPNEDFRDCKRIMTTVYRIIRRAASRRRFGDYETWRATVESDDAEDACIENTYSTWLDMVLDDLDGDCAKILRLERLAFWSKGYRNNFIHRRWTAFGSAELNPVDSAVAQDRYERRRRSVNAFNPLAWSVLNAGKLNRSCFKDSVVRSNFLADDQLPLFEQVVDERDRWNVDAWFEKYANQGIPRRSSAEYIAQMAEHAPVERGCFARRRDSDCREFCINDEESILCQSKTPPEAAFMYDTSSDGSW